MTIFEFFSLLTQLLPFILLINGLTQAAGLFGLKGRGQLVFALVVGLIIGELGYLAIFGIPLGFSAYIWAGAGGLFIAVISVLFYEMIKDVLQKAVSQWIKSREEDAEQLALGDRLE